jgi:hypothetical protein
MFKRKKATKQTTIGIEAVPVKTTEFKCEFCGKSYEFTILMCPDNEPELNVCAGCIAKALRHVLAPVLTPKSAECSFQDVDGLPDPWRDV